MKRRVERVHPREFVTTATTFYFNGGEKAARLYNKIYFAVIFQPVKELVSLLSANPYFAGNLAQLKGS